jgi:hypothetical protein
MAIVAIGAAWAVYASGPNGEQNCPGHENGACPGCDEGNCPGHEGATAATAANPAALRGVNPQDVTFEVTNVPNGVLVKITSARPEVTRVLQARFADYGRTAGRVASVRFAGYSPRDGEARPAALELTGQLHCGHAEGSEACQKAHESGQCQGHEPGSAGHSEEKPTP